MTAPTGNPSLVAFGQRVRSRRIALGLTQDDFADRIGMSRVSLSRTEAGQVDVTLTTLLALAGALGVTTEALLHGEPVGAKPDRPASVPGGNPASTSLVPTGWARNLVEAHYREHPEEFANLSSRQLAARIGVTHVYVNNFRREMGIQVTRARPKDES